MVRIIKMWKLYATFAKKLINLLFVRFVIKAFAMFACDIVVYVIWNAATFVCNLNTTILKRFLFVQNVQNRNYFCYFCCIFTTWLCHLQAYLISLESVTNNYFCIYFHEYCAFMIKLRECNHYLKTVLICKSHFDRNFNTNFYTF